MSKNSSEIKGGFSLHNSSMNGVKYDYYQLINGERKKLVSKVKDGSIITRFDKTPYPKKKTDVVCPHFLELKWGYGCPFNCSWCFLKGTLRMVKTKTKPVVKDYSKIKKHLNAFFENDGLNRELLNSGELSDSLMSEHTRMPFSEFIVPLFNQQSTHKLLMLTKSTQINNLLKLDGQKNTIMSFSLNAASVSQKWEKAPPPLERIKAGAKLANAGYRVRARIDPMVPIENWREEYEKLIDAIFANFEPERITLGSLRGLHTTIRCAIDKSWTGYLSDSSNWGKKIDDCTRFEMYSFVKNFLKDKYNYRKIAFCKETIGMWGELDKDWKNIKCNCIL